MYAEPSLVDAAAREFADTEAMIPAVEELYGPYRWGRYDLLVLPPSFPFGGMENPRLTFATPTMLAGDKSLVSLVAHELAHSWSGNLVTNATWSDFWLNEGFTVYVERRVLEKVYGREREEMEAVLGRRELDREMAGLPERDRVLHLDLDRPRSRRRLHAGAVREGRADAAHHRAGGGPRALRSVSCALLRPLRVPQHHHRGVPGVHPARAAQPVPLDEWIYRPGIPPGAGEPHSDAFARVEAGWPTDTSGWTTHEWLHFLRSQKQPDMARLDREFHLTESGNSEILRQWLLMAVAGSYEPALAQGGGVPVLGGPAQIPEAALYAS